MKQIKIYTDGSGCSIDGPGGWASIIIYPNDKIVELSGGYLSATNNQMELMAILEPLWYLIEHENLNHISIEIVSDSEYCVKGFSEWLPKWQKNGWKSKTGPVKNQPLWKAMIEATKNMHIKFSWCRGHVGIEYNERADKLAGEQRLKMKEKQDLTNKKDKVN